MTKDEAIVDIRDNIKPVVGGKSLDMAIKALEQEPILDKIKAEIMQLYNEVEVVDYDHNDVSRIKTAHWIIREEVIWILDKYNSCPKRGANMREGE